MATTTLGRVMRCGEYWQAMRWPPYSTQTLSSKDFQTAKKFVEGTRTGRDAIWTRSTDVTQTETWVATYNSYP
jgi:hypothetical protein